MIRNLTLRNARPNDLAAVDTLLSRSYRRLLRHDYPPSIMVTIVPLIARARPDLLASGRYFVVEDGDERVLGAGGYSLAGRGRAEIRHLATNPDATRRGIGRQLMAGIFLAAGSEGVRVFDCLSTRTAVPFYASVGFKTHAEVLVPILPAFAFPAVRMQRKVHDEPNI